MDPVNIPAKFEVRSFPHSWDNRGYWKNLGRPWIRPRSLFSQIFKRLLLGWTLWIYLPNLKFVALRVPEIIWGTGKIWAVPAYAHAPFSPKFLTGFCSHVRLSTSAKDSRRRSIWKTDTFQRSWFYGVLSMTSHRPLTSSVTWPFEAAYATSYRWSIEAKPVSHFILRYWAFKIFKWWRHHWRHETWIDCLDHLDTLRSRWLCYNLV